MRTVDNRKKQEYRSPVAVNPATGFDSPSIGGRTATSAVFYFRPRYDSISMGASYGEASRPAGPYAGLSTLYVRAHPFDRGGAFQKRHIGVAQ